MVLFGAIAAAMAADLGTDWGAGTSVEHLLLELGVMILGIAGALHLWAGLRAARVRARSLAKDLDASRAEAARWRRESQDLLRGLSVAIDRQLERWGLTAAEREVAMLLLKGLGHREVAQVRGTSERTARQQALSIYRKAGLSGRAELSAFFLEDLLPPPR